MPLLHIILYSFVHPLQGYTQFVVPPSILVPRPGRLGTFSGDDIHWNDDERCPELEGLADRCE